MNNYKLIIQYDGTNYAGWQVQHNSVTVQQKIIDAVEVVIKEKVILNGSGRTDAGVHALGQAANFRTEAELDLHKFKYQLNSILPQDISIISVEKTYAEFHSRFDAKRRSYIYLISAFKSPFLNNYSWYLTRELDLDRLNSLSKLLTGKKDFSSFCKTSSETNNKICEVYRVFWREVKGVVVFYICADRFLHGMVRTIVGTLLESLKTTDPEDYLLNVINTKNRKQAGEAVPAKGLFLYKVDYGD